MDFMQCAASIATSCLELLFSRTGSAQLWRSLWDGLRGVALSHRYVPALVSALRVYIPNACVFQTLKPLPCPTGRVGSSLVRPLIVTVRARRFKPASALLVNCRVACLAQLTIVLAGLTSFDCANR